MRLKVKFLKWFPGVPVAMLNLKTAQRLGIHSRDRISIRTLGKNPKELSTVVGLVEGIVGKNQIALSSEVRSLMNLRKGQFVEVSLARAPKSLEYIKAKLDGKRLTQQELDTILKDLVSNSLSEAEVALFVSAMYKQGMNFKEIIALIKSMLHSGEKLNLRNKVIVDKHCVGGVAGNRTTPIVVSICASAGLVMPKNSSRAITSAAGTADVVEVLANVEFTKAQLEKLVRKVGACLVWEGPVGIVPADSKIIRIERMLGIDPKSQLLASIMSKKLAVGSNYILIDIPYGRGAKIERKNEALSLKREFEKLARYFKVRIKVVLTDGSQPIGNGVGPVLEMMDVLSVLDPSKKGPKDLEEKALFLAGEILEMAGKAKKGKGKELARDLLSSGKAFKKFKQIIEAQGGKIKRLAPAKFHTQILSKKKGEITHIDNRKINFLARIVGCPLDKDAGLFIHHHVGEKVEKGEPLLTFYAQTPSRLKEVMKFYKKQKPILIQKAKRN